MVSTRIGYGAGQSDLEDRPNLLRIILSAGSETSAGLDGELPEDRISIVETCIDDMNPELFGFLMDRLFADGALDVYWIPVYLKKNRPGTMLQVLCKEDIKTTVIDRILSGTTTVGLRYYYARRLLPVGRLRGV